MSAPFALIAQGGFNGGHMGGWGRPAVVAMGMMMGGMGWMTRSMMRGAGSSGTRSPEEPGEILKARYARGELTTEEFQQRLRAIDDARL